MAVQGVVAGVHDGLPWRDADQGEGTGDVALHSPQVRHGEKLHFCLLFL